MLSAAISAVTKSNPNTATIMWNANAVPALSTEGTITSAVALRRKDVILTFPSVNPNPRKNHNTPQMINRAVKGRGLNCAVSIIHSTIILLKKLSHSMLPQLY
jgi:hypothetical protein